MEVLPDNLKAFAEYKQFIVWHEVDNGRKKLDKVPVHHETGENIDAHNKENHIDHETAIKCARKLGPNCHVGFVITKNDDFWFIDFDNCIDDKGYSKLSLEIYEQFYGAAFEISHSIKGFHLFGRGPAPEHKKKNIPLGLEFYTEDRFIAITGISAVGDANYRNDNAVNWLVNTFFKPDPITNITTWNNEPSPMWRGPDDDDELIKQMLKSHSFNACNIKDLWSRNVEALTIAYPAVTENGTSYDESSADAALCLALAWWTGFHAERIERLFSRSALVRDKWLKRADYRKITIESAIERCSGCLGEAKAIKESRQVQWSQVNENDHSITLLSGPRIVPFIERPTFFKNHFYELPTGKVICPDGLARVASDYNSCYAGYEFLNQFTSDKPIKKPWDAYVTATDVQRVDVSGTVYRPEFNFLNVILVDQKKYVNTYVNLDIPSVPGDITPFMTHLKKLLPNGNDAMVILCFMAAFIQHPGVKFRWAPFIQGVEGCGKSLLTQVLAKIIGESHVYYVNVDEFMDSKGKFNGFIENHRLIVMEEISSSTYRSIDGSMKRLIDHPTIEIQRKGVDQVSRRVCCNYILNSNFKDALPINENSRRYAPLFCAQQSKADLVRDGLTNEYFKKLFDWLENQDGYNKIAHFLRTFAIPDELNPAIGAYRAPDTTSFNDAVSESMPELENMIREAISSDEKGVKNGWVSCTALLKMIEADGGHVRSKAALGKTLSMLGYNLHPALLNNKGRTNQGIAMEGGGRVKLYITDEVLRQTRHMTGSEVSEAYRNSQGYMTPPITVLPSPSKIYAGGVMIPN